MTSAPRDPSPHQLPGPTGPQQSADPYGPPPQSADPYGPPPQQPPPPQQWGAPAQAPGWGPQGQGGGPAQPPHGPEWQAQSAYGPPAGQPAYGPPAGQPAYGPPTGQQAYAPPLGQPAHGQSPYAPPNYGQPGLPPAAPDPGRVKALRIGGIVAMLGAVVVGVGSVVPWVNTLIGPVYGTDGDGVLSLVLAVLIVLVSVPLLLGKARRTGLIAGGIFGLLAAALGTYHLFNLSGVFAEQEFAVGSMGAGPSVILIGALAVVIGNVVTLVRS